MLTKSTVFLFLLFIIVTNISSQTVIWDGGAGTNNWEDALNWNTNQVPSSSSIVKISVDSVSINNPVYIKRLELNSSLTIQENGFLIMNEDDYYPFGIVIYSTGRLYNEGFISISGNINRGISGSGTAGIFETLLINNGDIVVSALGHGLDLQNGKLINNGTIITNKEIEADYCENDGLIKITDEDVSFSFYQGSDGSELELSDNFSYLSTIDTIIGNTVINCTNTEKSFIIDHIIPGFSAGTISFINVDFVRLKHVHLEIGEDTMDQIIIDGDLIINSQDTLSITLLDGYIPQPTDTFQFISVAGNITNSFENIILPSELNDYVVDYSIPGKISLVLNPLLPVEFISFEGKELGNSNYLNWKTASETNNAGYYVEWKNNVQPRWQNLSFITGSNDSHSVKEYSYVHEYPISGNNYYRLKQSDLDGNFHYSTIVVIQNNKNNIIIYPRIIQQKVVVETPYNTTVEILDCKGQRILLKQIHSGKNIIFIPELISGMYYVLVDGKTTKIIKH